MKINAFNLRAFGPFTDKGLDFSGTENGLHVIYGENEAGKSSSLRAVIAWLYGFSHRVVDDWLHGANKLAVGGELVLGDGELMRFTRFKRRKNDLVDDDTGEPFEQGLLDRHLAGKSKADFENAYGISHDSLRRGVESVLALHGELGQTLFTATSGLSVLKDVLAELEEKQAKLFAPQAQKPAINSGISLLADYRKKIREASVSHARWKKMKKELAALENGKQKVEERLSELTRTIGTATRCRDALKYVTRFQQVETELDALASVPELSEDFAQQRIQAQAAVKQNLQALETLGKQLETIEQQMRELPFDDAILANQEMIETLVSTLAIYTKESIDSKTLRARIHQNREDVESGLKLLNAGLSVDALGSMRLSKPARSRLQKLVTRHTRMEQSAATADNDLKAVELKLKNVATQLSQTGVPVKMVELQRCLERAAGHGNLEAHVLEAQTETACIRDRVDKDLAALGLWQGDLEAFEKLAVPTDESMRKFARQLDETAGKTTSLEKEIQRSTDVIQGKQRELDAMRSGKELPDPEDLQAQRAIRDRGWRAVRAVWLEGGEDDEMFLKHFPEQTNLADAYEISVRNADHTADVLHRDAKDIAVAQTLKTQISELENILKDVVKERDIHEQRKKDTEARWQALWQPLGIFPLSPAEMIEWTGRVRQLKKDAVSFREKMARKEQVEKALEKINTELLAALKRLTIDIPEEISHAGLVDMAKYIIRENETLAEQRKTFELRIQELTERKREISEKSDESEGQKQQWLKEWEAATQPLKLPRSANPDEVLDYVDSLDDMFKKVDDSKAHQQRIDAMERNQKAFIEAVQDAISRLAPHLADLEPEKAVSALKDSLSENLNRRQKYQMLQTDRRNKTTQLSETKEKLAGGREILRQLCVEAGTSDQEQLAEVERQARRKSSVLKEAASITDRLSELASGQSLEEFVDVVRQQDPDSLSVELEQAEIEKTDLTKERERLMADIAVSRSQMEKLDGQSEAARLAVEADGVSGKIRSDVDHYVKLRMASSILARAIERYRKHNESPVLEAAGHYFKTLTRGSFSGLKADFNDKGEPVLKAVRPEDDIALPIEALSDGTRDQMFLALRLGGLSRQIENGGRFPFIVDDILVHFDDERSSSALSALSDLADKTQIIFFTHHKHLVGLAEKTVPEKLRCTHFL